MKPLLAIASCLPLLLAAQPPEARLDTAVLRIGEHAVLTLSLEMATGERPPAVQWPVVGDTLARAVEVVRRSKLDTLREPSEEGASTLRCVQHIVLTSFDTGYHAIPPFRFLLDGRTVETDPLLLEVRGVELDSASAVRDIHPLIEPPFDLLFWLEQHWYVPLAFAAVLAALWLLWRRRRTPAEPSTAPAPPAVPIHERILAELRALEAERLWQQGLHKAYHSRITDLLRAYIEERYGIPALERTTDELVQELRVSPLNSDQQTRLANMLHLADLVKFAKAVPPPAENEQMLAGAIRLVEETAATSKAPSHAS